jgi:hypothetical protein
MPTRLGPRGLGVNGGVRHDALLAVFLVPDTPASAKNGAVNRHRSSFLEPGLEKGYQTPPQAINLSGEYFWNRFQPPIPRPPRREMSVVHEASTKCLHFRDRLLQHGEQFVNLVQSSENHDDQRFQKEPIRVDFRMSSSWRRSGRHGNPVYQTNEADQKRGME